MLRALLSFCTLVRSLALASLLPPFSIFTLSWEHFKSFKSITCDVICVGCFKFRHRTHRAHSKPQHSSQWYRSLFFLFSFFFLLHFNVFFSRFFRVFNRNLLLETIGDSKIVDTFLNDVIIGKPFPFCPFSLAIDLSVWNVDVWCVRMYWWFRVCVYVCVYPKNRMREHLCLRQRKITDIFWIDNISGWFLGMDSESHAGFTIFSQ